MALFAMFFGAGNLIFPPLIGLESGTEWPLGFLVYFIADVGLAMVSILAMLKADGDMDGVTGSIGKVPSTILNVAILVCIGPLLAIPRTAATSYEMGVSAFFGASGNSQLALMVFSAVFLAIVFLMVLTPDKVVSNVGRILTPVLVATLGVIIVAGIVNPASEAGEPLVSNLVQEGIVNGYQTMDVIAALAFSIVAVRTVKGFGYADRSKRGAVIGIACAIAAGLLLIVYGGLAFLGATTGRLWSEDVMSGVLNQADLLSYIAGAVLGNVGAAFLAVVVLFACLTTAIGLVSSCAGYFYELLGKRVPYKILAGGICLFSLAVCNIGLTQIISISSPILSVVYPVAMFLVVTRLLRRDGASTIASKCGALVAFALSLCTVLCDTFGVESLGFVHALPLYDAGLGWVAPTVVAAVAGLVVSRIVCGKNRATS